MIRECVRYNIIGTTAYDDRTTLRRTTTIIKHVRNHSILPRVRYTIYIIIMMPDEHNNIISYYFLRFLFVISFIRLKAGCVVCDSINPDQQHIICTLNAQNFFQFQPVHNIIFCSDVKLHVR